MCLLVNVNEEKQNLIKAKSFHFLLRNLNDKHFKMSSEITLHDRKKLVMVVSVVSFRGVLLSKKLHFSLHCVSDQSLFHCPDRLLSTISCWLTLLSTSLSLCKVCPSAVGVKYTVRAITLIEQNLIPVPPSSQITSRLTPPYQSYFHKVCDAL